MEMSLTHVTASTVSNPLCFSNQSLLKTHFLHPTTTANNIRNNCKSHACNNTKTSIRTRRPICVKAAKSSPSIAQSLSTNWDVSNLSISNNISAPWLPRFEELDTTNMLLRQRIIFLGSQVDDLTADFIISQLLFLDVEDSKKDIKLFINSPGGSVTAGMGIYDAMKLCKADVSTICMGLAASMGAFLLAAGTKGKRFCMPNGRVMIHQPLGTAGGKATEMSIRIREMSYHKLKLNKILSRVSGKPLQQIELDTDRDYFMSAWEAKEYGLVDEVIDDGKPGLVAPSAEAIPPPKTRIWDMWKIEGSKKAKKNLPSEQNMLQNGYKEGEGSDKDRGPEQEKETSAPV
ncbi:ATP-dependent Clp protease proteolytic subunit [Melia azedarach]|uniref:ATP-dependent Clp protease proteolytic subunit n=1 Tax=Melia azedarach TaxID=155640 RepID=A0ACC1X6E4_MELAZ|nr:ATP-dependent Clp protease proteolytic subunit [Melia azedarach]